MGCHRPLFQAQGQVNACAEVAPPTGRQRQAAIFDQQIRRARRLCFDGLRLTQALNRMTVLFQLAEQFIQRLAAADEHKGETSHDDLLG